MLLPRRNRLTTLIFIFVSVFLIYFYLGNIDKKHHEVLLGHVTHGLPKLYILTATHSRLVQKAELTRMCNTLRHVPNIFWIVVEDSVNKTSLVTDFLQQCKIPHVQLNIETPAGEKPQPNEPYWFRPKGTHQRNLGLEWLRQNLVIGQIRGVLYIADDDNTYDVRIFEEMRFTKRVSTWPVAFSGELPWEGCITSPTNRKHITQMWSAYKPDRPFPIDMAGFAVNIDLILNHPKAGFDYNRPRGMQESQFLLQLGLKHWSELEPLADGCQKILVWHTRTAEPLLALWKKWSSMGFTSPPMPDFI